MSDTYNTINNDATYTQHALYDQLPGSPVVTGDGPPALFPLPRPVPV